MGGAIIAPHDHLHINHAHASLYVVERLRQASNMHSRTDGMWWGTAIEAPDPGALANFYSEPLGWPMALALGATVARYQPQGNVRVLFDPAGHPFCLCREDD
jgi:hypothetical protein